MTCSSEVSSKLQKFLRCSKRGDEGSAITTRRTITKQTQRHKTQTQTMTRYANYNADATQSQHRRKHNAERDKYQKELKQELRATAESLGLK